MGGSSSSSGTVRYARYIEDFHNVLLGETRTLAYVAGQNNPYDDIEDLNFQDYFTIAWLGFNIHLNTYDIDSKWNTVFNDSQNAAVIGNMVNAESSLLDDDIEQNILPRFKTGLRDMNAVLSSSFVLGKANIESSKVKSIAKFDAEARYKMIPIAQDRWARSLQWKEMIMQHYMNIAQIEMDKTLAIRSYNDQNNYNSTLWDFTVMDIQKSIMAGMQGMASSVASKGPSQVQSAVGGAVGGVAAGAMLGSAVPGLGTVAGGIIGGAVGLAGSFF